MPPAWPLARNSLSGRPGRTLLLLGAVTLAASLIVAVSCAIASAQKSIDASFKRFLGTADVRVIHPSGGRFDESVLETVRSWPGVEAAIGRLGGSLTLVRADRAEDPETGRPRRLTPTVVGIEPDLLPRFQELRLRAGALPETAGDVLLDPMSAEALAAEPGDELVVQRFGPEIRLTVCGVYERQNLGALQRPRIYLDRRTLADASGLGDQLTSLYAILEEGLDVEAFVAARAGELPREVTLEPAEMVRTGFDRRVRGSRIALTVSSVLTFICAGFIIVTGLTTGVTERQRELALLRAIGASRGQLFSAQLIVGGTYGIVGALLGVPVGIGLAALLVFIYREHVTEGVAIHGLGIGLAVAGSLLAGLLGAVFPAAQAARTAPLEAMSVRARPPRAAGLVACAIAGLVLLAIHHLVLAGSDPELRFWRYLYLGLPSLLIGCFLLAVPVLLLVGRVLAPLFARALRVPPDLLLGTLRASPYRHGFTAGSLMVGIALLVSSWAGSASIQQGFLERIRFADGFAFRPTGIPADQVEAIRNLPFVEDVCEVGQVQVRIAGEQVFGLEGLSPRNVVLVGFDAEQFFRINTIDWVQGDPKTGVPRLVSGEGMLVAERFLVAKGYEVGDRLTLAVGRIEAEFEIVGVVGAAGLDIASQLFGIQNAYNELATSCVFLDARTVADVFDNSDVHLVQVMLSDDVTDAEAEAAVSEVAPGVLFRSGRWIVETIGDLTAAALAVQTTVAFGALLLASLAVGNVIAANVTARRYELGVLRSIGAHATTVGRLILAESALMAVAGGVVGSVLGVEIALADVANLRDLAGLDVRLSVPWVPGALGFAILVVMACVAALPPVRRMRRQAPAALVS